jgi:hypothetical protein
MFLSRFHWPIWWGWRAHIRLQLKNILSPTDTLPHHYAHRTIWLAYCMCYSQRLIGDISQLSTIELVTWTSSIQVLITLPIQLLWVPPLLTYGLNDNYDFNLIIEANNTMKAS